MKTISIIGYCPICGSAILEYADAYGCSNYDRIHKKGCKFKIWKEIAHKPISPEIAEKLLNGEVIPPADGFISNKDGKPFRAGLRLNEDLGKVVTIREENYNKGEY